MSLLSLRQPRRFRPSVEALEDRQVMSCTITLQPTSPTTFTLVVRGAPNHKNNITINDDGTAGSTAIQVICDNTVVGTLSGAAIDTIDVSLVGNTKPDKVTYNLTGPTQTTTRYMVAHLGNGGDTFIANLNASSVSPGVQQSAQAFGGSGNDTLKVNANKGTVYGALAQIIVVLEGGAGNDDISFNFSGSALPPWVDLLLLLDGGPGNDTVSANLSLNSPGFHVTGNDSPFATPPGGRAAQVNGGAGNDTLRFVILGNPPSPTPTPSFALVDGGPGHNKCHIEGFVNLSVNCQSFF
jgi:hypothetical protein